ncbi:FtsK/SpoIIIE domain-containing protein [Robertmurraya korlensis]|uniref:DNA translocase FtsK n=1 Tax=Robertmurraya korlensis TaxID=519977 RepID=UPI00204029B6|nr:DNA translocase FtsK [Robertmurraya korlensis]MCM3599191.1 FtsK/SpoIIIE domain-containing protein [Robertmurraya korlensis]
MNWFKKLFSKISDDDEVEEINEQIVEPFKETKKEQKDIDARIVYQYPKGKFKFPLIPDEREMQQTTRKSREERTSSRQRTEPERKSEPVRSKPRVGSLTKSKVSPPPKSETKNRDVSRRPFRPTEIPSPVYGFEKRGRTQEEKPVEYELNSFLKKEYIERSYEAPVKGEKIEKQAIEEVVQVEEPIINTDPIELVSMDPTEELLPVETGVDLEYVHLEQIERVNEEVIEEDVPSEPTWELEVAVAVESSTQEEVKLKVEQSVQIEELQVEVQSIQTEEWTVAEEELEQVEVQTIEESMQQNTEQNIKQEELDHNEEPPFVPAPKRSHLPFNVLMLKEDRRKLEEKRNQIKSEVTFEPPSPLITEKEAEDNEQPISVNEIAEVIDEENPYYVFPVLDLLSPPVVYDTSGEWLEERERLLNDTLESFNVRASVVNVTQGPSVTRFEVQPEPGVKVNKITNLADDIKLSLAAKDIRIEAPIPGKHTIGIEVPNEVSRPVLLSEIVNSTEFLHSKSPLTAVLGLDISGKPIVTDLRKMPHGLIAGATGSGKSVCINTILVSLLYKARPDELKLLLIDPKMVELAPYNQIPHLVSPVITDVKAATAALKWAVEEMERRYELFAHTGVREINRFNEQCEQHNQHADKLPFIVIIIDELADLMMMAPADVEEAICRIAQKARACGIHLIIATQRPSVDVITGLIKANVPTRIAFSVSSQIDSRTIIDIAGAERLLGRGDMLFLENGSSKPVRLQGTFVSDEEIDQVVAHVRREQSPNYLFHQEELLKRAAVTEEEDELFFEACEFVVDQGSASTSSLQRRFKIGYNRAARLIDMMEKNGYISENRGSKPRDVLINQDDLQSLQEM